MSCLWSPQLQGSVPQLKTRCAELEASPHSLAASWHWPGRASSKRWDELDGVQRRRRRRRQRIGTLGFFQLEMQGGIFQSCWSLTVVLRGGECMTGTGTSPDALGTFLCLNFGGSIGSIGMSCNSRGAVRSLPSYHRHVRQ